MNRRLVAGLVALGAIGAGASLWIALRPGAAFHAVGPRLVANDTAYPVWIYGRALPRRARLVLGEPWNRAVDTAFVDDKHLAARLPADLALPAGVTARDVAVRLTTSGGSLIDGSATLTVVNNRGFPSPVAAAVAGSRLFVAVPETDEVWAFALADGAITRVPVGDGPCALALRGGGPAPQLVVAHRHDGELRLVDTSVLNAPQRRLKVGAALAGVAVAGERAYVSDIVSDDVAIVDLGKGTVLERVPVGVNPGALAAPGSGRRVAVANLGSADVTVVYAKDASALLPIAPRPGVPIVGGRTAAYSAYVIGGRAPRDVAFSERLSAVFIAFIGPNVGPNPDKMEVSMNPGIGVVDVNATRFARHVSAGFGSLVGLSLDDGRGILYAADVGAGRVLAFSADRLVESDAAAAKALLADVALEPDSALPTIRPRGELTAPGRAGSGVHAGPRALALAPDGATLYAVSHFGGAVWEIDVAGAAEGRMAVGRRFAGPEAFAQKERRLGQILYSTDLGKTGITCDGCHVDGHTDTVLFAKTHPLRLYRVPTLRWIRETAPYFNPRSVRSLEETAKVVMGRNRFHNPDPSPDEIAWLGRYQATLVGPPNPYVAPDGAPPETIALPDGRRGRPARGAALFGGKAGCAASACHPPPMFSADQDATTRGVAGDVGAPVALPIRTELQDLTFAGIGPPSLVGAWDVFPMFASGAAGLGVRSDGRVGVVEPFALGAVLSWRSRVPHGNARALSPEELDDLLAYLLTL